ncbi:unnamed protein product [Cuscuta epithymum]|uniref:DUF4283 domain-containing protein n=1 Tax=Cuscuta epithymum TaxID=186058 RepID=A0AAV0FIB9_9ASTE|nr:unnamed protein product [Cuscuta epithymum]
MARKKNQGPAELSAARVTRTSFGALVNTDEEFPALNSGCPLKKTGKTVTPPAELREQTDSSLGVQTAGAETAIAGNLDSNSGTTIKKPWSTLFKDNRAPSHGIKLKFVPPKGNSLDFSDRVMPSMVEMWGYCLVGCFTGRFPGLKAIHELKFKWGVKCQIKSHDKGWVIFKFQTDEDRMKVLNEGPYTIFGKLLMLKVLSDDFTFDDEEFLKVPIWVKFPQLPMKLWNKDAMSEVASMVGVPLTTDLITQERSNHNFARVLIEVDVSKPPPLSFPIRLPSHKVIKQLVVYETFPNFCFHCKKYGHHPFICKELAEKELKDKNEKEKKNDVGILKGAAQDTLKDIATRVEKSMEIEEGKLPDAQLEEGKILEEPGQPTLDSATVVEAAYVGVAATSVGDSVTEENCDITDSEDQYETEEEQDQEHHFKKTTKKSRRRKGETDEKYKRRLGRMIGRKIK